MNNSTKYVIARLQDVRKLCLTLSFEYLVIIKLGATDVQIARSNILLKGEYFVVFRARFLQEPKKVLLFPNISIKPL